MLISKYFDHVAIVLSTICIVHCLAVPVVVALLPVLALTYGLNDAAFHTLMLWFVVPSSVLGFAFGYHAHRGATIVLLRRRRDRGAGVRGVAGHGVWTTGVETAVNVAASVLLAVAHWRNFRAVRRAHSHHF